MSQEYLTTNTNRKKIAKKTQVVKTGKTVCRFDNAENTSKIYEEPAMKNQ